MASGPVTSRQIEGETMEIVTDFIFLVSKITVDSDCSHKIKRRLLLGRKAMTNLDSILKSKDIYFVNKAPYSQGYGLSSSNIWLWELDHKESRALKIWCFQNCGVGEDFQESLQQQGNPTSQSSKKSVLNIHWKDWCWSGSSNSLVTWCKQLTH